MPKTARVRVASPPAGTALARAIRLCLPNRVLTGRDSPHVTISVTIVNRTVTSRFPGPIILGKFCLVGPVRLPQ